MATPFSCAAIPKNCTFKPMPCALSRRLPLAVSCHSDSHRDASTIASSIDRRTAMGGLAAATVALFAPMPLPALAEDFETFYGMATPPTSYGGYGGNDPNAMPKYKFEYPAGWKSAVPNKVEKGTQGIDCRVFNPRNKNQQIVVITFGRAGEDNKSFRLTDIDTTIAGFAGADYDLQDAISSATEKTTSERDIDGQTYYDVLIDSPDVQYLSTVTVDQGKVYAMFLKCPTKLFKAEEATLRHVVDTFRTI